MASVNYKNYIKHLQSIIQMFDEASKKVRVGSMTLMHMEYSRGPRVQLEKFALTTPRTGTGW
jgi:hypothetical protein